MSATSLEAAWDHFVAECAAEGVPVEPVALIESGALGRAVTHADLPAPAAEVAVVRSAS